MRRVAATLVALIAAAFAAFVAIVVVFPFGLILHEAVIFPLALGVSAIFASLAAGWTGTLLGIGGGRTRLLPVAGVTLGAAALLAAALLLFLAWAAGQQPRVVSLSPFQVAAVVPVALALTAALATARLRSPSLPTRKDLLTTLALLALAVLAVPASILLAAQVGLAGA